MAKWIKSLADMYIVSYEGIATLAIILIMLLKLFINRSVEKLQFKKMMVGIPSEITFLLIGFLLPAMISKDTTKNVELMACFLGALIVLVIQYAMERWLDDKLSGKLGGKILVCIIIMYIMSLVLYKIIVFGGVY